MTAHEIVTVDMYYEVIANIFLDRSRSVVAVADLGATIFVPDN